MLILGIETSCDETGIALVKGGREVISESLVTQIDIHSKYGGVVPELAARQHAETIDSVLNDMLNKTEVELRDIDGIAVTYGPGLPGALLCQIGEFAAVGDLEQRLQRLGAKDTVQDRARGEDVSQQMTLDHRVTEKI